MPGRPSPDPLREVNVNTTTHAQVAPAVPLLYASNDMLDALTDALWSRFLGRLETMQPGPPAAVVTPASRRAATGRGDLFLSVPAAAAETRWAENSLQTAISQGRVPVVDLMAGAQGNRMRAIPAAWIPRLGQIARGEPVPEVTRADVSLAGYPMELGMLQLQQVLGCCRSTAIKLLNMELIPSTKGSGHTGAYRVKRSDVEDFAFRIIHAAAFAWNSERGG